MDHDSNKPAGMGIADVNEVLQRVFGFEALRPGQEQIVMALIEGRSALALFPTGAGKSLCYQLPGIMFPGLTLVVSPLLALMREQVEGLQARGIAAARLDSTLTQAEVEEVYRELSGGRLALLYVAPERFANERFRDSLKHASIELLAIDEAHCISEWGHNFRPDYLKLADFVRRLGVKRCLALTATATPSVAEDIRQAFGIAERDFVRTSFRRDNLHLHVTPVPSSGRDRLLADRVRKVEGPVIVYVTLQFTAESVAGMLRREGLGARAYHAGMRAEARAEVHQGFMAGEIQVVVATIAFGMGIDKSDVRAVFHYNLPKTLENYAQEIGRAGRDGLDSHCEVLACLDDLVTLENFIHSDTPDSSAVKSVLEHVLMVGEDIEFSPYEMSRGCDVKPAVVETLLTYLELGGWLESRGAIYGTISLKFLRNRDSAFAGHTRERQGFLRRLFACGSEGRGWLTIDVDVAAGILEVDAGKIRKTIGWLESHGDVVVKVSRLRQRYRRLKPVERSEMRIIVEGMRERFVAREERDLGRLAGMVDFLSEPGCLVLRLLSYFGEEDSRPCGTCTSCRERDAGVREIPGRERPEMELEDLKVLQELMAERHAALRSPRQIARFLCGLASPAATAARLKDHQAFGVLEGYSFEEVLIAAESLIRRPL